MITLKTHNVQPDPFDDADVPYNPPLLSLPAICLPSSNHRRLIGKHGEYVRNQGINPYCTAMALANVIDYLIIARDTTTIAEQLPEAESSSPQPPSQKEKRCCARMLYEMATAFDEYPDDDNKGSSLRGAIKGFYHNGAYRRSQNSDLDRKELDLRNKWILDIEKAKDSRNTILGRYARVLPSIQDYQSAVIDVGIIFVSASIHSGWEQGHIEDNKGRIPLTKSQQIKGNHAFAIIGYNDTGFLVLNSAGRDWGQWSIDPDSLTEPAWQGVALWSYADWSRNVLDAWVLRLGVPVDTTQFRQADAFRLHDVRLRGITGQGVTRILINGHYLHVADGRLVSTGAFSNDLTSIRETARLLQANHSEGPDLSYSDLIIFIESGLQSLATMAERCYSLTTNLLGTYPEQGSGFHPYPFSIFWRRDVLEITADLLEARARRLTARTRGYADAKAHMLDVYAREFLQPIWRTFEGEADRSFGNDGPIGRGEPWLAMKDLLEAAVGGARPMHVHFVVHSSGMPWFLRLVDQLTSGDGLIPGLHNRIQRRKMLKSITLLAPICSIPSVSSLVAKLWGKWHPAKSSNSSPLAIYRQPSEHDSAENLAGYAGSFLELARRCFPLDGNIPTPTQPNLIAGHAADSEGSDQMKDLADILELLPIDTSNRLYHANLMDDPLLMKAVLDRIKSFSSSVP